MNDLTMPIIIDFGIALLPTIEDPFNGERRAVSLQPATINACVASGVGCCLRTAATYNAWLCAYGLQALARRTSSRLRSAAS